MRYEPAEEQTKKKFGKTFFRWNNLAALACMIIGLYLIALYYHLHLPFQHQAPTVTPQATPAPIPEETEKKSDTQLPWVNVKIKAGESLAKIFQIYHLSPRELHAILELENAKLLHNLKVGQVVQLLFTADKTNPKLNQLIAIAIPINEMETLTITKNQTAYDIKIVKKELTTKIQFAHAKIKNSFLTAAAAEHIPKPIVWQLMKTFGEQIDFSHHIRPGDSFTVEYEMLFLKQKFVRSGNIIAATFTNRGKTYTAIRYKNAYGNYDYYTVSGHNLRKGFLRRPVPNSWVSSPFNMHRMHPILGYIRPHTGTDFAANYGTPIHATGDGRIIKESWYGGYGRCVMINHGHGIVTLYGHMSRFASKLKVGSRVKEDQVIGYIGESGLAKGAHVHYEVRINGKFQDPMKVKLPEADPLPENALGQFIPYAKLQIARMDAYSRGEHPDTVTVSPTSVKTPTAPTAPNTTEPSKKAAQ